MTIDESVIIKRITNVMKARGMKQKDLADRLNVDASKISLMLSGKPGGFNIDSLGKLNLLAEELGVELPWLIFGKEKNMCTVKGVDVPECIYDVCIAYANDVLDAYDEGTEAEDIIDDVIEKIEKGRKFTEDTGRIEWYVITRGIEDDIEDDYGYAVIDGEIVATFSGYKYTRSTLLLDRTSVLLYLDCEDASIGATDFISYCLDKTDVNDIDILNMFYFDVYGDRMEPDFCHTLFSSLASVYGDKLAITLEIRTDYNKNSMMYDYSNYMTKLLDEMSDVCYAVKAPEKYVDFTGNLYANIFI